MCSWCLTQLWKLRVLSLLLNILKNKLTLLSYWYLLLLLHFREWNFLKSVRILIIPADNSKFKAASRSPSVHSFVSCLLFISAKLSLISILDQFKIINSFLKIKIQIAIHISLILARHIKLFIRDNNCLLKTADVVVSVGYLSLDILRVRTTKKNIFA